VRYICGCSVVSAEDICGDFNVLRRYRIGADKCAQESLS